MNRKKLFYLIVALQVFVLLGITASYYLVDYIGEEVSLKTEPIDPRDIFYGDYVILNYEIQSIPRRLWEGEEKPENNQKVYLLLEKTEGDSTPVGLFPNHPDTKENEVVLQGLFRYEQWEGHFVIDYGLERYYVPEGTGKEIEDHVGRMSVIVKVAPWGQAKISRLDF